MGVQEDCNVVEQTIDQLQGLDIIISNAVSSLQLGMRFPNGMIDLAVW